MWVILVNLMLQRIMKCWDVNVNVNVNSISRHRALIGLSTVWTGTHSRTHSLTHTLTVHIAVGRAAATKCAAQSASSQQNRNTTFFPPTQVFTQTPKNNVIKVTTFFCLTFHSFSGFLLTFVRTTTFHIHFTIITGRMSYWFQNIRQKIPFKRPT